MSFQRKLQVYRIYWEPPLCLQPDFLAQMLLLISQCFNVAYWLDHSE